MKSLLIVATALAIGSCTTALEPEAQTITSTQPETDATEHLKGVRYIMSTVSDIDRTLAFYNTAVDFEVVKRYQLPGSHFDPALLSKTPELVDVALVKLTNTYLKLVDFDPEDDTPGTPLSVTGPGYTHICFKSPATNSAYTKFRAAGLDMVSHGDAPVDLLGAGTVYAYGNDPDGTMIELEVDERPRRADDYWIGHVANITPDIDRMLAFYELLIGYPERRRGSVANNAKVDAVVGLDDTIMTGGWYALRNMELEFWQFQQPVTSQRLQPAKLDTIGYSSVAYEVTNLTAEVERLSEHGIEFIGAPFAEQGWSVAFAYDPDGTLFSLEQNVSAPPSESIDSMLWIDPATF